MACFRRYHCSKFNRGKKNVQCQNEMFYRITMTGKFYRITMTGKYYLLTEESKSYISML